MASKWFESQAQGFTLTKKVKPPRGGFTFFFFGKCKSRNRIEADSMGEVFIPLIFIAKKDKR